ncbi:MAG: CBS domain-containing protein [Sterolibacteriaceae bacterium]|uniref:CBS domain-containing protein n=1 Tax=Candidatus Methylophosphatis roskildensis TaxID=2899263 RepID=A0A9D7E2H2_9PROT|nr:CBS domain-containing protein [Candidatus Methylophosphatis roskildensis]MBK7235968.1 CBS domain-containing protein [Sterolibacteriaceae bacterium]
MDPSIEFILTNELRRIEDIPPFDQIPEARLGELLARSRIVFFRCGSTILHPEIALPAPRFWIVRRGRVRTAEVGQTRIAPGPDQHVGVGALFPVEVMLDRGGGWRIYSAEEDCYLWQIEGEEIDHWLAEPALLHWIALGLQDEQRRIRESAAELTRARQLSDQVLAMPARSFAASKLECVESTRSIGDVAALMAQRRVGSLLVGSPAAVEGIVTQTDLVVRGLATRMASDMPVSQVMTQAPRMLDDAASVLEAGIEMAQNHCRHLLLRSSEGQVVGLVSERDIFRAQQHGVEHVFKPIDEARSVAELVDLASRVQELAQRVFRQGMEVSQFMRLVSSMNGRISRRLLRVLAAEKKVDARFCWLAFGSEAREEQGFVTDQDNGIVFIAPTADAIEPVRSALLEFAAAANDGLDACGFPRCKGNIMAGNPEWCMSLDEWKARFSAWIRSTTPKALLNAAIFFDLRATHGDEGLADAMLDHLLGAAKGNTIFLHQMAINALEVAPPVGRISRFATEGGRHGETIDLKTQGSRLFVDTARIYALANGVRSANTAERLRVVGQRIKRSLSAIEGDIAAFRFVQAIRLRRQLESMRDGGDPNRVDPYSLDELQQRILRESLRQAVSLQSRLKVDYRP